MGCRVLLQFAKQFKREEGGPGRGLGTHQRPTASLLYGPDIPQCLDLGLSHFFPACAPGPLYIPRT